MKKKWIDKNFHSSLEKKNILITGGNSGIGFEFAKICAYLKANIFLAVRNIEKANKAKENILKDYPNTNITLLELDLSSLASIDKFVEKIIKSKYDFDVFYNNAGIFHIHNQKSFDGFELVMATNYIGTYYLSKRILNYLSTLEHEVKYILTSSIVYKKGKIDYNHFFETKNFKAYYNSKLAITKYYCYLKDKYKNSNINVLLVHPGITSTPLIAKAYNKVFAKIAQAFMSVVFHKPEKAALCALFAIDNRYNVFVGPRGIFNISGYPKVTKLKMKKLQKNEELIDFTDKLIEN